MEQLLKLLQFVEKKEEIAALISSKYRGLRAYISELTPYKIQLELTNLASEVFNYFH